MHTPGCRREFLRFLSLPFSRVCDPVKILGMFSFPGCVGIAFAGSMTNSQAEFFLSSSSSSSLLIHEETLRRDDPDSHILQACGTLGIQRRTPLLHSSSRLISNRRNHRSKIKDYPDARISTAIRSIDR